MIIPFRRPGRARQAKRDMPEMTPDHELDRLLGFHEEPAPDGFVLEVMHRVQGEQRRRRLILAVFGLAGAAFGVAGALTLSGPISDIFSGLPVIGTMQVTLAAVASLAFYGWLMNEDISIST
jgi:hypothetical protein